MNDKQTALTAIRDEFNRWESLLANLSEAQITVPQLDDNWSIKDVVAHLHAWQQRSVARFEAALHHQEPEYPAWPEQFDPEAEGQPHDLNAWLYAQSRDKSWSQVHEAWHTTFQRLVEVAQAIPESDLLEEGKYPWLEGYPLIVVLQGTSEHHQEHAEYLEPVIAQQHE